MILGQLFWMMIGMLGAFKAYFSGYQSEMLKLFGNSYQIDVGYLVIIFPILLFLFATLLVVKKKYMYYLSVSFIRIYVVYIVLMWFHNNSTALLSEGLLMQIFRVIPLILQIVFYEILFFMMREEKFKYPRGDEYTKLLERKGKKINKQGDFVSLEQERYQKQYRG